MRRTTARLILLALEEIAEHLSEVDSDRGLTGLSNLLWEIREKVEEDEQS